MKFKIAVSCAVILCGMACAWMAVQIGDYKLPAPLLQTRPVTTIEFSDETLESIADIVEEALRN